MTRRWENLAVNAEAEKRTNSGSAPSLANDTVVVADPTFRRLLGDAAWRRLDPAVRARFAVKPAPGEVLIFAGTMGVVRRSWFGWLLAQACRLIGTPLVRQEGRNVPTEVRVSSDAAGGIVWARRYAFADGGNVEVRSTKRPDPPAGLLECVGYGLGMRLRLFERDGALHFVSVGYCVDIGRRRIRIPDLLTPGEAHVVHKDEGGGWFRFTLRFRHRWFGETCFQQGLFRQVEGAS